MLERGDEYLKVFFSPRIAALEQSREQMQGTLLLNTLTQQIEQIEIYNTEKLSPAFSVTVYTFRLAPEPSTRVPPLIITSNMGTPYSQRCSWQVKAHHHGGTRQRLVDE